MIMITPKAVINPTRTCFGIKLAINPSRAMLAIQRNTPTIRANEDASKRILLGSPTAKGMTVAPTRVAVDASGPTTIKRELEKIV